MTNEEFENFIRENVDSFMVSIADKIPTNPTYVSYQILADEDTEIHITIAKTWIKVWYRQPGVYLPNSTTVMYETDFEESDLMNAWLKLKKFLTEA